jgi:nicotinate-nucleotide pyrophosphorylase (carboxylating)
VSALDPPITAVRAVVAAALAEDLGVMGDITSLACVPAEVRATAWFAAREGGVLAGTVAATETFRQVDPDVAIVWHARDGDTITAGERLGEVEGRLRSILAGERVALNLLTHCSGVATLTRRYVERAGAARIRDTRKTLPGLRALQKAAVRAGGGANHRDSLSDAVLIKDNHLSSAGIAKAVASARSMWPGRIVEVECETLEQVREAKVARVDLVLLDNMSPALVAEAVRALDGAALVEVSGRVTLETVAEYAEAGAALISVGAITHSVPTLDIGLDVVESR